MQIIGSIMCDLYLSCEITQSMCEQMIITKMKKSKLLEYKIGLAIKEKPIVYHNFRKVIFSTLFLTSLHLVLCFIVCQGTPCSLLPKSSIKMLSKPINDPNPSLYHGEQENLFDVLFQ
jgi:hypothetical protein